MASKSGLGKILDQLVDDDGLKTEITLTLTDQTLTKLSVYLIGTVIVSSMAFFVIRGFAQKLEVKKQLQMTKP